MRFGDGVSWPPQGKVPRTSSLKPRAVGERSLKWAVTVRGRSGRRRKVNCIFERKILESWVVLLWHRNDWIKGNWNEGWLIRRIWVAADGYLTCECENSEREEENKLESDRLVTCSKTR